MGLLTSLIFLAIPIGLVIAAGALIRGRGDPDTAGRRFFLFLVWTSIGLAAILITSWLSLSPGGYALAALLAPLFAGVMVMTLLHLPEWRDLRGREKVLILMALILLAVTVVVQFWAGKVAEDSSQLEMIFVGLANFSISAFLVINWTIGKRYPALLGAAGLLYLTLFNGLEWGALPLPGESLPGWMSLARVAAYVALPGLVIPTMAMLTTNALKPRTLPGEPGPISWRAITGRIALVATLLGYLVYTFMWLWIWDGTDDGVRGYLMLLWSGMAATAAGIVIGLTSTGSRRWTGLAFAVLVPTSIALATVGLGNRFHPYEITEARAGRIQEAVERYQEVTGSYPTDLEALVPGEFWRIPRPMIFQDQGWCYEGGPDFYRLGTIYREHWSSPIVTARVYASAGSVPETSWVCDEKLAEARSKVALVFNTPPTPVPLPTSAVSLERTTVQPVLRGPSFSIGRWSPDGKYLVFGLTEYYGELGDQVEIDLHFLDAKAGEVCQASKPKWRAGPESDGLREHYAWLPDGRLLYVSEAGEMASFRPCTDGVEELAGRYPVTFTHAVSFDEQSGRALLKNQDAYWLLDGASLEARQILDITFKPAEIYRGWYAWSPAGERLAISLMKGPETVDEAALYIVDGATGEVEQNLPLEDASDASLPIVDWLTPDDLLVHGSTVVVMDLRSDAPAMTDLIQDIFLLDIAYPDDFSSMDSLPDLAGEGYYLGLRANHPRNQGVYLYASETGQVEVFQHDTHSLFFFPAGQWMLLPKWEDNPTYRDEYEMVWMDQTGETHRLVVEGHSPRSHPQMFPKYLPASSQLVFSSSQGISLVSIPNGETAVFWELAGGGDFYNVLPSPGGKALVVVADGDGLYYIPLLPGE